MLNKKYGILGKREHFCRKCGLLVSLVLFTFQMQCENHWWTHMFPGIDYLCFWIVCLTCSMSIMMKNLLKKIRPFTTPPKKDGRPTLQVFFVWSPWLIPMTSGFHVKFCMKSSLFARFFRSEAEEEHIMAELIDLASTFGSSPWWSSIFCWFVQCLKMDQQCITGWWFGCHQFSHILGISSSQLTNSYFSEG